jgi:hypothetical protein
MESGNVRLASQINNEDSKEIKIWLEQFIFPNDFIEDNFFYSNIILYSVDLRDHHTLFYSIVHNPQPAKFSPKDINEALLEGCRMFGLNEGCNYFNVNVHDNFAYEIESVGQYSLKRQDDTSVLFPLYYLLTENRAHEGGTSYTGLLGKNKEWMFSIEFGTEIVFKVHGNKEFCEFVYGQLLNK